MPLTVKETIKFATCLLFALAVPVLCSLFVHPAEAELQAARDREAVRFLVPGAEGPMDPDMVEGQGLVMRLYQAKPGVAVVFLNLPLFDREGRLAVVLDGGKVTALYDAVPDLPPRRARFEGTLRDVRLSLSGGGTAGAGLDVIGGATIDYSRLSKGLEQLAATVRKAGKM
jgi:hypothetical protein